MLKPVAQPTSLQFPNLPEGCCVSIIGMAGAGKTTVGRELARGLDWAFLDTDYLIESTFAASLQSITDALDKEAFLDLEAEVLCSLRLSRTVLSTGGSVIYRPETIAHLKTLGPLVYLDVPLDVIIERIARKPDRGLAIAPGQTVEDLFCEREALYRQYATWVFQPGEADPSACAQAIAQALPSL